jgi:hypothetical protein
MAFNDLYVYTQYTNLTYRKYGIRNVFKRFYVHFNVN